MKYLALIVGKVVAFLLKILGRHGGSFPGQVALIFSKDILRHFKYPKTTILVTGTNGKTSTANMIAEGFRKAGYDVVSNSRGDNIIYGISSLLMKNSGFDFKVRADVLVLEVDELTLAKQLKNIDATDVVITNFFRDQLDRVGEMESIILKMADALKGYRRKLYLNEDDPNVKRLMYDAKYADIISFGVEKLEGASEVNNEAKEGKFCPKCSLELLYDYYHYSHIGKYNCSSCDFDWKRPDYVIDAVHGGDFVFDLLDKDSVKHSFKYNINADYHLYNMASASAVFLEYSIADEVIDDVFYHFKLGIGRMEYIEIAGEKVLLNLVKNPTGMNEIIKYIGNRSAEKSLMFILNDNDQDGTDTSWIWDAHFERVGKLSHVILSGKRAYEAALRFKVAGIKADLIVEKDINKAIDILMDSSNEKYVISTYTALFNVRNKMLSKSRG